MQQKQRHEDLKEQRIADKIPCREAAGEGVAEDVENSIEEAQEEVAAARRPWYQTRRWGLILLAVYGILLALFTLLAVWVAYNPVLAIDVTITRAFQENQSPWLRYTMIAASFIGNVSALSLGLIVLAAVLFWIVHLRLEAIMVVVVSATSALLNWLIMLVVARPRPSAKPVAVIQATSDQTFASRY